MTERFAGRLLVPTIVLFEVDRWMRRNDVKHEVRMSILNRMTREPSIPVDHRVAIRAGVFARTHQLATADALIAGSASIMGCALATFDLDFATIPGAVILAP